jgi:RNA polymerase sigma factor (sigma-70 family)
MQSLSDAALLAQYAAGQSEAAFAELVQRHIALVHSAALRQVGNPHLAEEVTQAVFIILARKAGSLGGKTVLAGWLCRTAYLAAHDALKCERRRQQREHNAYLESAMNPTETDTQTAWQQLAPLLDEAVAQLGEADRAAVVLRYFEQRPLGEVGAALGVGEDAAQKRVTRALDKLHKRLASRGVTLSVALIAGAVSGHAVQAAPVNLAAKILAMGGKGVITTSLTTMVSRLRRRGGLCPAQPVVRRRGLHQ